MKKIIALLLVVGCMLAFASCNLLPGSGDNGDGNDNVVDVDNSEAIAALQAAIDASAPDIADISVVLNSELGKLNGEYDVTYNDDGSATVIYSYELFNKPGEGDGFKSTYTGETTVSPDGTVADALGGTASVEAVTFDITLDESKLTNVIVSQNSISAKVAKANTLAVLGVALDSDAEFVISVGKNGVASVAISYVSGSGVVDIRSTYTYIIEEETEEDTEDGIEDGTTEDSEEVTE